MFSQSFPPSDVPIISMLLKNHDGFSAFSSSRRSRAQNFIFSQTLFTVVSQMSEDNVHVNVRLLHRRLEKNKTVTSGFFTFCPEMNFIRMWTKKKKAFKLKIINCLNCSSSTMAVVGAVFHFKTESGDLCLFVCVHPSRALLFLRVCVCVIM